MRALPVVAVSSACVLFGAAHASSETFHAEQHFSTKTPYWSQQDPAEWTPPPQSCEPVLLEGVIRHGARNPGRGDIKKLTALQALLKEHEKLVRASEYPWAADWVNTYDLEHEHLLVPAGEKEHYDLAKRIKLHFPAIFAKEYMPIRYDFQSTQVSRTSQSASAFVYGLFEGTGTVGPAKYQPVSIWSDSLTTDRRLRFYDHCQKYLDLHDRKSRAENYVDHVKEFEKGPLYTELRHEVSKKLGIDSVHTLTTKELHAVFRACNYDTVQLGKPSPWCDVLGERGLRIMEYRDEMKQWWLKSHAYDVNFEMACPLLVDMFNHFERKLAGSDRKSQELRAHIRFAHAETVIPFVTMLGFFRGDNEVLHNDLPYESIVKRNFSSSYVSPYTANVLMILYKCGDGEAVVKLLLNEKEYTIPGCSGLYCPLSEAKEIFRTRLQSCDFDGMCAAASAPQSRAVPGHATVAKSAGTDAEGTEPTMWDVLRLAGEVMGLYDHV